MAITGKGIFGQLVGPFEAGHNYVPEIKAFISGRDTGKQPYVDLGISIAEKDFMLFGKRENDQAASFEFAINGQTFFMGRTDMYETSDYIKLDTLTFPKGAPASVTVDFRIYLSD